MSERKPLIDFERYWFFKKINNRLFVNLTLKLFGGLIWFVGDLKFRLYLLIIIHTSLYRHIRYIVVAEQLTRV